MFSNQFQFCFVHVPKTAGKSILHHLSDFTHQQDETKHWTAKELRSHCPNKWDRYFSFGFVRNPWDRLVSEYYYHCQLLKNYPSNTKWVQKSWINIEHFLSKLPTFSDFIENLDMFPFLQYHGLPQVDHLCDESGNILVDFVGQFEYLQQDFNSICKKIGMSNVVLPSINASKHPPYQTLYTQKTRQIVAERYAKDIRIFGYVFDK